MGIFSSKSKIRLESTKKKEMPEGLWHKCPSCGEVIHNLDLEENCQVCPKCDYHFQLTALQRLGQLLDPGSYEEMNAGMRPLDPLNFKGLVTYTETLAKYQKKTGLIDAVNTGVGSIKGHRVAIAVMDFGFLAATMGSVVGEKITRLIERGTRENLPVIIIAASGGARMYEGVFSLMQMAKTSGALARHGQAKLPFISILTHPTTGGVSASFATLGDVIIAEPKAMIGFAGPRVIKETTHQDLPPGFQTAEFLEEHGLVDLICDRRKMRDTLGLIFDYFCKKK